MDILENLPFKESRKDYLTRKYGDMWNLDKFDHRWERSNKNYYDWFKANNVIKKYLGKSFNEAFSYYCKLVPQYEQSTFLGKFNLGRHKYFYHYYIPDYIIDDDGNIQINPKSKLNRKPIYVFRSFDYEYAYKDKITGEIKNKLSYYKKENLDNYDKITTKGIYKTFNSITPEYKALIREDYKKEKRFKKQQSLIKIKNANTILRERKLINNKKKKEILN